MRLINADKLYPDCMTKDGKLAISQSQIANAPTAELETANRGKMIIKSPSGWGYCSECGKVLEPQDKFCWNCGAKMETGGEK